MFSGRHGGEGEVTGRAEQHILPLGFLEGETRFFKFSRAWEVSFVKRFLDGEFGWSTIGMLVLIGGIGAGLVCLLWDVWKFDRGTSPAWQVGVHHLALALLFAMTFVFVSRRPFAFSVGFRRFTLTVWVLAPVLFF